MSGTQYVIAVTSNNLVGGTQRIITYQGDANVNPGKTPERVPFKNNEAITTIANDGFSATFSMAMAYPLGLGAAIIRTSSLNDTDVYAYIQSSESGGDIWHGPMKVSFTVAGPVKGPNIAEVMLSQNGIVTWAQVP